MAMPTRLLFQTTIPYTEDDWHVGRFSQVRAYLESLVDAAGQPLFTVQARNRGPVGQPDPVLSSLSRATFDQLWLFAVDVGDGLHPADCAGIDHFRRDGGGLLVTRDHMDLGSSVCGLAGVGAANFFHTHQQDPELERRVRDDAATLAISWPNFHSGANGDFQALTVANPPHPLLRDPESPTGLVRFLPSHPHEGAVAAPPGDATARVIATGRSKVTGAHFNLAVAFEPSASLGPAVAESTFHHFVDLNWWPDSGCPSFVSEPCGDDLPKSADAQASIRRYAANLAFWLSGLTPPPGPLRSSVAAR